MDCYSVDILYLSEAFGGARIRNCDIKPTDGSTDFTVSQAVARSENPGGLVVSTVVGIICPPG